MGRVTSACAEFEPQPKLRRQCAFQSGYQKPSLRAVVRGLNPTAAYSVDQQFLDSELKIKVHGNRDSRHQLVKHLQILRTPESHNLTTEENQEIAGVPEAAGREPGFILYGPHHSNDGRGIDAGTAGLVVETDVTSGNWSVKGKTGFSQSIDCLGELPHRLGIFRTGEIKAIRRGQWHTTRADNVPAGLRY